MASLRELNDNLTVVTSKYVMEDGLPILYVSHDFDEEGSVFQFHCDNGEYDMEKMLLVKLETIIKRDKSLSDLIVKEGEEARRKTETDNWIIKMQ